MLTVLHILTPTDWECTSEVVASQSRSCCANFTESTQLDDFIRPCAGEHTNNGKGNHGV